MKATGEHFTGTVTRYTDSLDRSTRTMQVEIDVQNDKYKLQPGTHVTILHGQAAQEAAAQDALQAPIP